VRALIDTVHPLIGLFVDDGTLAAIVLAWIGLWGLVPHFASLIPARWGGVIFFLGLVLILIENVFRTARRRRPTSRQ
jgi:hypothetical protein